VKCEVTAEERSALTLEDIGESIRRDPGRCVWIE